MDAATYKLKYIDSAGDVSERVISAVTPAGPDEISAICHLRHATRTFRLPRIEHLLDLASGELITDPWAHFGVKRAASESPPPELPAAVRSAVRALFPPTEN